MAGLRCLEYVRLTTDRSELRPITIDRGPCRKEGQHSARVKIGRGCVKVGNIGKMLLLIITLSRIWAQLVKRPRNFNDFNHYRIARRVFTQLRPKADIDNNQECRVATRQSGLSLDA